MTEVETKSQAPSEADELQSVVNDILSGTTLAVTSKTIAAAEALSIEPSSLQIVGEQRNLEAKFAEAIAPIKTALQGKENPTSEDLANMVKARQLLDKLIAINEGRTSLETEVTADTILQGFKKLDGGVIELTLPVGTTIQEAGKLLNAAAKEKGMKFPVFECDAGFWAKNEENTSLQTEPGRTYQFKIPTDSVSKTRAEQVRDHGEGAPLGAIAIAEACERLNTENNGTLFKDANGNKVWVRGSAPGVALHSFADLGVS
ncbi:MAG: hypothetical protein KDD70_05775, partial [Bdellovibrionales bacterium]|nr:hypothetical protein [Bdellovibrionales bacterium]